jgi:regulator of replication initiation timing
MSSNTTAHHEDFDAMLEEALDAMDANNVRNLYSDMHEDEAYANLERQLSQIFESVTRVGGEVCRMRAEVDELLEQNQILHDAFKKLKEVICEKGVLDLDDFQLACDVFDEVNYKPSVSSLFKKMPH